MSESTERNGSFPCRECQAGMMRLNFITYFTWLDEEVITVPNFPAWVCDVCGRREYDEKAVNWLSTLLNPDAGHASSKRKRSGKRPAEKRGTTGVTPEQ
jgi:YgiT-type zinc finger domain-containing protein